MSDELLTDLLMGASLSIHLMMILHAFTIRDMIYLVVARQFLETRDFRAGVAELADAQDLKSWGG